MLGRRQTIARLQSDFYRDQFHKMLRWLMVSVVMMLMLIVTIIYLLLVKPSQDYYANTLEGKIIPMPQQSVS
jgi:hypothetical protein